MSNPVGVGVIGLGPRWRQHYRSACEALPGLVRVVAVCDPVAHRAALQARRLDCLAAAGPTDLLESDDIEAVLLLGPTWYRLWPIEVACRLGKPVFCCGGLDHDPAYADRLYKMVRDRQLPVMLAMNPRAAPAFGRLHELLGANLGPARVILCEAIEPENRGCADPVALLDCCAALVGGEPVAVLAGSGNDGALASLGVEFEGGRAVQLCRCRVPGGRAGLRLRVIAEGGTATAQFPNRLYWTDSAGSHSHVLPMSRPPAQVFLERFYHLVRSAQPPTPSWDEAYRLCTWLRAAARSRAEGRRILLQESVVRGP
jgi:predicted dehydrogenase